MRYSRLNEDVCPDGLPAEFQQFSNNFFAAKRLIDDLLDVVLILGIVL